MIRVTWLAVAVCVLAICSGNRAVKHVTTNDLQNNEDIGSHSLAISHECLAGICFDIISNEVSSENLRHVELLMKEKNYSLRNLKKLFAGLSERFPTPKYLTVVAYTDESQIRQDGDGRGSSGTKEVTINTHHWAIFNRHETQSVIRYTKVLNSDAMETLVFPLS